MSSLQSLETAELAQTPIPGLQLPEEVSTETAEVRRIIGRVGRHLARPPRIALIGEFNTGKSTLANALLGNSALPDGMVESAQLPVLIHYATAPSVSVEYADGRREPLAGDDVSSVDMRDARLICLGLPLERLRSFELIDTPGLATGQCDVDELALDACQRANIAIWCTTAMQAWKRTEMRVWEALPKRLKHNSILAVTYKDAIDSERDISRLRARLRQEVAHEFRSLVLVAATEAAQARTEAAEVVEPALWQSSGGASFSAAVNAAIGVVLAHRLAAAERLLSQVALSLEARPALSN